MRPAPPEPTSVAARRIAENRMERLVQLLDELEDFLSLLRHQFGLFP